MSYILLIKGGEEYEVPASEVRILKQEFKGVDVDEELLSMGSWCRLNPAKRKTRRGIGRFIHNWLSRSKRPKQSVPMAGGHVAFKSNEELCKTSEEDKRRGLEQLRRMEEMQRRLKG